ncbi:hypothetical protein P7C73_g6728, partial [Tremellales sp. Uapishka_1]
MGLLCFFAIIEACIVTYLVAKYNNNDTYPSDSYRDRLKFLVFTSWWTVVFSAGYIAAFLVNSGSFLASIASHGIWLFITWVFWTAGVASLTHALGGGQRCSHSTLTYCSQLVAAEAFGWIEWILITLMLIFVLFLGGRAVRKGDSVTSGLV